MSGRPIPEALVRAAVHPPAEGTDADLLGRFVAARDPAAFAELVSRHGPMVLGVCRRALGDTPDADDAFQAVWLVLVRKAQTVSPRGKVGHWLYGVAARTVAHARARNAKRSAAQRDLPDVPDPRPPAVGQGEQAAVLDAELARLPERYRAAIVLCELEGRSLKEAVEHLDVPLGTLASRLSRGRALLAERLKARGFAASALAALLAGAAAPVSARLSEQAGALATAGSGGPAQTVSELTHGVIRAMRTQKLVGAVRAVIAAVLCAGAVGLAAWGAGAQPKRPPAAAFDDGNKYAGRLDPKLPRRTWEEAAWDDLAQDEPLATRAVLDFAAQPKAAVAFFKTKLHPLKADRDEVKKLIADLGSEKEGVWQAAFEKLGRTELRLALDPEEAFAEAKTDAAKLHLATLLVSPDDLVRFARVGMIRTVRLHAEGRGKERAFHLVVTDSGLGESIPVIQSFPVARVADVRRPTWTRDVRAVVILERIGTPEAQAILKDVVTGHADAPPTRVARQALDRLNPKAP